MSDYMSRSGRIFDIQRYSIHDGVGVRTIVFLKGCALRCRWCCNPESQSFDVETMTIGGKTRVCGRDVTVSEVMETVARDIPYYGRSGGGLTLSGGECTLQPEFAEGLLHAAKDLGLSTAIESMAFAKWEVIEKHILPYLDTYLCDIKHMNPQKHAQWCGKDNIHMLDNIAKIAKSKMCELIIRVPVVPGFNDTDEELLAIARFAENLPGVKQIHLLPYHNFGEGKYEGLNKPYGMGSAPMPAVSQMEHFRDLIGSSTHLRCQIGG